MDSDTVSEITQLVNRYGHVADNRDFAGLTEVFARDAVFDQSRTSGRILEGRKAILDFFALEPGPDRPHYAPAHHATNIVVFEVDGTVCARSKLLCVDGATGMVISGDYEDEFVHEDGAWRIARRAVSVRWHPRDLQTA